MLAKQRPRPAAEKIAEAAIDQGAGLGRSIRHRLELGVLAFPGMRRAGAAGRRAVEQSAGGEIGVLIAAAQQLEGIDTAVVIDLADEIPDRASRGQQPLAALVKREIARWTTIIKAAEVNAE